MRLLDQNLNFYEFFDEDNFPNYIILSHTWGADEVTHQDLLLWHQDLQDEPGRKPIGRTRKELEGKSGFEKIRQMAILTSLLPPAQNWNNAGDGTCQYFWIDTCCIDKTSSAELSEAINSMFRWYAKSKACIVWLNDVVNDQTLLDGLRNQVEKCKWLSRGWTLQELIAPRKVYFFDKNWEFLGTKFELGSSLSELTGIPKSALVDGITSNCCIAQKFSWMRNRRTTRKEDMAYCLLGLFEINMPILYGEGANAFQRLQEEIVKVDRDASIFCWKAKTEYFAGWRSVFADDPSEFADSSHITWNRQTSNASFNFTQRGLRVQAQLIPATGRGLCSQQERILITHCVENSGGANKNLKPLGVRLMRVSELDYVRVDSHMLFTVESAGIERSTYIGFIICHRLSREIWNNCHGIRLAGFKFRPRAFGRECFRFSPNEIENGTTQVVKRFSRSDDDDEGNLALALALSRTGTYSVGLEMMGPMTNFTLQFMSRKVAYLDEAFEHHVKVIDGKAWIEILTKPK